MSDRNGGRPASRVEPRIAVAIQSAWCFPTAADLASQADRRAGDRLLLARTLRGLRRMGATGIVDNAGSGSLWSTFAHERYYRHAYTTTAERIAAVGNWMQFHRRETALSDWDAPDYRL